MQRLVPGLVITAFVAIALWHVYMALGPRPGNSGAPGAPGMPAMSGAVPSAGGKPLFVPSRTGTLVVAAMLLLFAALVAAASGMLAIGLPRTALAWLCHALALGLLARAVGDFNYLGFFKRVKGSRFAVLDTRVYSPVCLALAAGVEHVAWHPLA